MTVTVHLTRGRLRIENLPEGDALDLVEEFKEGDEQTLSFDMDGAIVIVARRHVVRIDLETA